MTTNINGSIEAINRLVRQQKWFDFYVWEYKDCRLTIAGGVNLDYYHTLEIIFEEVFFVSGFFKGWRSNTGSDVLVLPDNPTALNRQYEIEQGYQLFIFKTEDYKNDIIIAAQSVTFQTGTVYYYHRQDLKENESIAQFVKK